jgi:hypothetical protein
VPGYSETPLAKKLGIATGSRLVVLSAPAGLVIEIPAAVRVRRRAGGGADVVLAFFTSTEALERRIEVLGRMIFPSGGLWIAWPKKTSGLATDVNQDVVRRVALPRGLVDNKVCAIDDTWSGLRLVWRLEKRR